MLNPILIDPAAFARDRQQMQGEAVLADFDPRVASHEYLAASDTPVAFSLRGGYDGLQRPFLDLHVQGTLSLLCQRCVQPMPFALDDRVRLVLFGDEAALDEAMQAEEDLEGMMLSPELDVRTLLEEQILMAVPYSPRHGDCRNPDLEGINQNSRPNPFAVLAGLKNSR